VKKIVADYLSNLEMGPVQNHKNMTMIPLLLPESAIREIDILLLDEAVDRGLLVITEIDEAGSVPELKADNLSDKKILILDGEELVGAKQNRIVNTTILLPPKESIIIPVSCVEQGRWHQKTEQFNTEKRLSPSKMRQKKSSSVLHSLSIFGDFSSNQSEIWEDVRERIETTGIKSETMEMASFFRDNQDRLKKYQQGFQFVEGQTGAIFGLDGNAAGIECLCSPDIFKAIMPKLIESYAADAMISNDSKKVVPMSLKEAESFLDMAKDAPCKVNSSVGLGKDIRISSRKVIGHALVHDQLIYHLSLFRKEEEGNNGSGRSKGRMQSMRSRRIRLI